MFLELFWLAKNENHVFFSFLKLANNEINVF